MTMLWGISCSVFLCLSLSFFSPFIKILSVIVNFSITVSLDVYGIGLIYTSATLAAATTNCLPVITFFLALLLR